MASRLDWINGSGGSSIDSVVRLADGCKRGLEFARARNFDHSDLHPDGHGVRLHVFDELSNGFVARIDKKVDAPQARSRRLDILRQLAGEFVAEEARAGDVAPRFYET